jgi:hypothetical protein
LHAHVSHPLPLKPTGASRRLALGRIKEIPADGRGCILGGVGRMYRQNSRAAATQRCLGLVR